MLSLVASMYDPLGLVVPIVIVGRLLFREATKLKHGWDDSLPEDLTSKWFNWLSSLETISSLRFPRVLVRINMRQGVAQLHHFCDASEKAYGVVTYLRVLSATGNIHVSLLMGKGRVAPLKYVSIPRLELCGAVQAVKVDAMLREELDVDLLPSTFWTDSHVVLGYIRNETRRFKVFVANRVGYILKYSEQTQWRYVSTDVNPADVISRGCLIGPLPPEWVSGAKFLKRPQDSWIKQSEIPTVAINDPEERSNVRI